MILKPRHRLALVIMSFTVAGCSGATDVRSDSSSARPAVSEVEAIRIDKEGHQASAVSAPHGPPVSNRSPIEVLAGRMGWLTDLERGNALIAKLTSLNQEGWGNGAVAEYNGQAAFVGATAPPGETNDLVTKNSIRLHVVVREQEDLRPHAVWWEVMVRGKVLQVLPTDKIIVIEVDKKGWVILQTG